MKNPALLITAVYPDLSQLERHTTPFRRGMNTEMKGFNALIIAPGDNVAVALKDIFQGEKVIPSGGEPFVALCDIPYSHKVALIHIRKEGKIVKYGETIAVAKTDIKTGEWVHIHNVDSEVME